MLGRIALVAVLVVAAGEVGLRLAGAGAPPGGPAWERLRRLGPDGGVEIVPGGRAAWALAPGQPVVRYELNGLGLRETRELPARAPAGTCRILALGDAYTFGYGVTARDAYPRRLEHALERTGRFEVLNAGFPNLNVEQERRRLDALLPRLRPDLILLSFDWWNVPTDDDGVPPRPRKWSVRWIVANVGEKASWLAARSALADAAWPVVQHALSPAIFPPSGLARELEPLTLPASALAARWDRTTDALRGMAHDAATAGARFAIVLTPLDLQLDRARNALYRRGRLPYPSHGFADVDYVSARAMPDALRTFARTTGIPLVDVTPAFAARGGLRLFLSGDYHVAPAGHRVIAREVARWIRRAHACGGAART